MSAFYDQASLVVVPSGYKSGKIYAQKPLTTDGQLTFTRASTATRVNASGLIETVSSGVPRLDYLGSTCPKLLLEPQRSNLALYSEQFDNSVWIKEPLNSATANTIASPDGYVNADTITAADGSTINIYQSQTSTSNTVHTFSAFLKKNNLSEVQLYMFSSGFVSRATVNFDNGTITDVVGSGSTITNYGNGWYRCSIQGTINSGVGFTTGFLSTASTGSKSVYAYGSQLEVGAYATSYIPTLGASVTRVADAASKTGISSLIGQTEGTLFVEGSFAGIDPANTRRIVSLSDATTSNAVLIQNSSNSTTMQFVVVTSGTIQATITKSLAITFGQTFKAAFAYKANDFVAYINGEQIGTDASGTVPTCSKFAFDRGNATTAHEGTISQALLFKTRLTNAQLAELTTL
jgi:hypothetical protein